MSEICPEAVLDEAMETEAIVSLNLLIGLLAPALLEEVGYRVEAEALRAGPPFRAPLSMRQVERIVVILKGLPWLSLDGRPGLAGGGEASPGAAEAGAAAARVRRIARDAAAVALRLGSEVGAVTRDEYTQRYARGGNTDAAQLHRAVRAALSASDRAAAWAGAWALVVRLLPGGVSVPGDPFPAQAAAPLATVLAAEAAKVGAAFNERALPIIGIGGLALYQTCADGPLAALLTLVIGAALVWGPYFWVLYRESLSLAGWRVSWLFLLFGAMGLAMGGFLWGGEAP